MMKDDFFAIGVMSGTSLDGVDLVYVKFPKNNFHEFKIIYAETVSYVDDWKDTLQEAINYSEDKLSQLSIEYGELLGAMILKFIERFQIKNIDFIASHGHTILHQPAKGITLQVGDGQIIANITKQKVICDFRTQDVQLGGQGAPLVPIGDKLLFSEYDYCLNLGGFANISFDENNERIAFDICPVNIVMNFYAEKLGVNYDDEGKIASKGTTSKALLSKLNSLEFYQEKPPKSLGLEWVQEEIFPIINTFEMEEKDVLRTFVEHIAIQIANQIKDDTKTLITGGGAFNRFLISRLQIFKKSELIIPSKEIIDFKEALVFAFLGLLRVENQVNCLKSVTGASKNHSSGVIFNPQ